MRHAKTPEEWRVIRRKYEHTDQPVQEICLEHGTTPNTLRDRVRRWNWTPRRLPIPREGPLPAPPFERPPPPPMAQIEASALSPSAAQSDGAAPALPATDSAEALAAAQDAPGEEPGNDIPTAERLQGAVVAVLANIETIVAKARTGRTHAGENERAARALAALTRTLRELKAFTHPQEPQADDTVDDIDEFRRALARKIDAFVATHGGGIRADAESEGT